MYQQLLTNRYLATRIIPFIAVGAVALCVALVIIVVSVMTGFLDMVRDSGRTLIGDVVVSRSIPGIGHYEKLIAEIEKLDDVVAATPLVEGWGVLEISPASLTQTTVSVQIWGVEPESFARVTGYGDMIHWRELTDDMRRVLREDDPRLADPDQLFEDGRTLTVNGRPSIALGMHVSPFNERQLDGSYIPSFHVRKADGSVGMREMWPLWMPRQQVVLSTIPFNEGQLDTQPESEVLQVANEFQSGFFLFDKTRVLVPIEVAQNLMGLQEWPSEVEGVEALPKRALMVFVRGVDDVTPEDLRDQVSGAYVRFFNSFEEDGVAGTIWPPHPEYVNVMTWEEQQKEFIGPIKKERELMRTLFSLVYLVCAGLVLAIFWSIVYEKTRDIGILRSVGASRIGISWIFLRYGLVIGTLGAIGGLGIAYLVVNNINHIHDAMGDPPLWLARVLVGLGLVSLAITIARGMRGLLLPVVLGGLITFTFLMGGIVIGVIRQTIGGVVIWDPSVYYFTVIPNNLDPVAATTTMIGAVVFSVLGAFIPAAKAADTDPVMALRYE